MSDNRRWEEPTVEGVKRAGTHSGLGRRVDMGGTCWIGGWKGTITSGERAHDLRAT